MSLLAFVPVVLLTQTQPAHARAASEVCVDAKTGSLYFACSALHHGLQAPLMPTGLLNQKLVCTSLTR